MKHLLLLLPFTLAGCVTTGGGSVAGSCALFDAPRYVVRGARTYDQDWIDSTIEGGVGGCHWSRPAARPAELDASAAPKKAAPKSAKRSLAARVKARVWPANPVAPVVAVPDAPVPVTPIALPAAPPRSAVDELLHPKEWSK